MSEERVAELTQVIRKKVAFLTDIISPYVIPRFNRLAEADQFDFDVFFLAETESNWLWKVYKEKIKFNYIVLKDFQFGLDGKKQYNSISV